MDFFKVIIFLFKQVLSHYFVSAQDLGAIGNMDRGERIMTWHHLFINPASFFIFKPVEGHMSISRPGFKLGQQIDYEVGLFDPDF